MRSETLGFSRNADGTIGPVPNAYCHLFKFAFGCPYRLEASVRVAVIGATAAATVIANSIVSVSPSASVTVYVYVASAAAALGVPEIVRVAAVNVRPAGSAGESE